MSRRVQTALAVLACVFAGTASAGAREDLHAAFAKFLAQSSFHGEVTGSMAGRATHSVIDFQAPDRVRVTSDGRPTVLMIGNTMYMTANGRPMKVPMTQGNPMAEYRNANLLALLEKGMVVEDQGADSAGHKYRYTVKEPQPSTSLVWVRGGLPVQLQTRREIMGKTIDTTIRYSRFSDPTIKISAPN